MLGQDGYYLVTERPWVRVDVTLRGTLPMDSPLPMPEGEAWRQWIAEVTSQLASILPSAGEEDEEKSGTLSWRGDPKARLQCASDDRLYLTGVYMSAWQGIDLPRQWDNPDREPDGWPEERLADFATWVRLAPQEWENCLECRTPE